MAINTQKVLIGGVVAGVVVNIIDFITYGFILGDRFAADANAFKPGLGDQMAVMSTGQTIGFLLMNFVVGILLVWTYASIRPRFGPGAKTAIYAAIPFWIFGLITTYGYMNMGITSSGLWWTYAIIWLVCLGLAALAGGRVYTEESAA